MKTYPDKILLAWGEALRDNEIISKWLSSNGYTELISFILSLKGSRKADKWLFENNHPELVALVDHLNGKKEAGQWLHDHQFVFHKILGDAVLEEEGAMEYLLEKKQRAMLVLVQHLRNAVKAIDFDANDVHKSPFR